MSIGKVFFNMKNFYKIFVLFFVLLNYSCAIQSPVSAQQGYVNNQVFYDQLSPYGQWIDNPDYGYVWIPDVDQNFSPYSTSGYWVMTDYGWTWVSDYSWGWATFHYGRWDYNNDYGWYWVPDNEWGPSWVIWRTGNGYYGWAPMRPGMNISLSFRNEYRDIDRWTFIRDRDFGQSDSYRHYADRSDYNTIITTSRVINNTYNDRNRNTTYISGPTRNDVQQVTGRTINNITIRDNDRPGQTLKSGRLNLYRPQIQNNNDRGQKPTPSRITRMQDVKPAGERNSSNQRDKVSPNINNQQQIDRRNQPQQNQQPQRQRQTQRQAEPQKQQQQTERQNQQQQSERQNQQQKQQVEKQQQEQQRQVQQQQQQERSNQQQQAKQQQEQQRQVQQQQQQQQQQERSNQQQQAKQQQEQQRQVQQQQQQQERSNQQQQVKQQKEEKRQIKQQKQSEERQTRKTQEEQNQQSTDPSNNNRRNR